MKAVVLEKIGGVEVLKVSEVPTPPVGPADCLVRIKYAAVNYADILSRQGIYNWQGKRPYILGLESSGTVENIGCNVTKFSTGDKVVIGSKGGNYAEYISKHQEEILPAPDGFTFEELACLCGNWLTAWAAIVEMARVREGEIALIHSGAGGVGTAVIQLAIAHHMKVYATASSVEKREYLRMLGAIDLEYSNFDEVLRKESLPDFILESVGGNVHRRSLQVLAPLGRMVSIGASGIKINKCNPFDWYKAWRDYPKVSRNDLNSQAYMTLHIGFLLEDHRKRLEPIWGEMISFMQKNNLKPILQKDCVYPMSQVALVHKLIDNRKNIGRLLLDPSR